MAQRYRSAVYICFFCIQTSFPDCCNSLGGERFIQFDQVHVLNPKTCQFQHFLYGICRTYPHQFRIDTNCLITDEPRNRLTPSSFTLLPDINMTKPVPSVSGADEAAVTVPPALNIVGSSSSVSRFVSGRMSSSVLNDSFMTTGPFSSYETLLTSIGMISSSNLPESLAFIAL